MKGYIYKTKSEKDSVILRALFAQYKAPVLLYRISAVLLITLFSRTTSITRKKDSFRKVGDAMALFQRSMCCYGAPMSFFRFPTEFLLVPVCDLTPLSLRFFFISLRSLCVSTACIALEKSRRSC